MKKLLILISLLMSAQSYAFIDCRGVEDSSIAVQLMYTDKMPGRVNVLFDSFLVFPTETCRNNTSKGTFFTGNIVALDVNGEVLEVTDYLHMSSISVMNDFNSPIQANLQLLPSNNQFKKNGIYTVTNLNSGTSYEINVKCMVNSKQ